jgi:3-oxoacyl-[acyl-carrier-protein] synthase III
MAPTTIRAPGSPVQDIRIFGTGAYGPERIVPDGEAGAPAGVDDARRAKTSRSWRPLPASWRTSSRMAVLRGMERARMHQSLVRCGNTGAASLPVAGFGTGMAAGFALLQW